MIPDFYVFDTNEAAELITNIESLGFNAFFSAKSDYNWLAERFINPRRYLLFWDAHRYGHIDHNSIDAPMLAISLPEEYVKWEEVATWIQVEIFKLPLELEFNFKYLKFEKPATQKRVYNPPGEKKIIEGLESHVMSIPPDEIDLKNGYSFDCFYDEILDIKYYEVLAPSSPTPFTVVVNQFSSKNDSWFFSDIYASNAWGRNMMESRYDFSFLQALWVHLKLPGEFTMDIVKRRVDSCYPDRVKTLAELEAEPSVYRRPMKDVMGMKRKRFQGQDYIDINPPRQK